MALEPALATILSPVVLFFVSGLGAALDRSDMAIPDAFAKGIAINLWTRRDGERCVTGLEVVGSLAPSTGCPT